MARVVYGALVWKEKRSAVAAGRGRHVEGFNSGPKHLKVGSRGERLAYWHLRRTGYVIVARNRRPHAHSGELDMVGWDGAVLTFIEVKTRTGTEAGLPETAVTTGQRRRIVRSAQEYMRQLKRRPAAYRFDVASVLWDPLEGFRVRVIKDAFRG